ncbi:MAG: SPOR domain-containing protein, partial [Pseudolabrys sp.]
MADDYTQRPYRPNEPPARSGQPGKALGGGSDPLAELARLIGQNDPFSEFGRDGVRRSAPPPQPPQEPEPAWD